MSAGHAPGDSYMPWAVAVPTDCWLAPNSPPIPGQDSFSLVTWAGPESDGRQGGEGLCETEVFHPAQGRASTLPSASHHLLPSHFPAGRKETRAGI